MNFHISNLSPLRPHFSSPTLGTPRDLAHHGLIKIEVEPADADADDGDDVTSSAGQRDDDDDDDTDSPSDASADDDDVTQDSRDVLVQRLTDLAARLGGASVRPAGLEALHRQVDEMERELRRGRGGRDRSAAGRRASARPRSPRLSSSPASPRGRDALGIMAPVSPSWFASRFQRRPSSARGSGEGAEGPGARGARGEPEPRSPSDPDPLVQRPPAGRLGSAAGEIGGGGGGTTSAPSISSEVAEDVVKEAEKLCAEMATVIESLQTRREESDHLHALLVQREEMANKRVHEKIAAVAELEDVVADNEAELRHLRLELRAIEVQCMGYVPKGADPELTQSIRNWKDDWQELRRKWSSRRGSSFAPGDESSTLSTLASHTSH